MWKLISRCGLLALSLSLCGVAPAQIASDARDAYIDGWFQETAEADLAAALKSYQRCVELAASGEPELAARAVWRMGCIARARGDVEVAKGLFDRVVSDYPSTEGARLAAAELTHDDADAPQAAELAAVEEAQRLLVEMLSDRETVTRAKADTVFSTLQPGQIVALFERYGGNLSSVVSSVDRDRFAPAIAELILRVDDSLAAKLFHYLPGPDAAFELQDALIERAARLGDQIDQLVWWLAARGDDRSLTQLERLLTSDPDYPGTFVPHAVVNLASSTSAVATRLVDLLLTRARAVPGAEDRIVELLKGRSTGDDTAAALRLRAEIPRLGAKARGHLWASLAVKPNANADADFAPVLPTIVDLFRDDPEPAVRAAVVRWLLKSPEATQRAEGMERFLAPGPPWDLELLSRAVAPVRLADWLERTAGELREAMYEVLLSRSDPALVVQHGVDQRDPALLAVLLRPQKKWSGDLRSGSDPQPLSEGYLLRGGLDRLAVAVSQRSLVDLPTRLVRQIAESPVEELRRSFLEFFANRGQGMPGEFGATLGLFVRDPSVALRDILIRQLWKHLSVEARVTLMRDPEALLALRAVNNEREASALLLALPDLDAERAGWVAERALAQNLPEVLHAALPRLAPTDPLAGRVLDSLDGDLEVVLWALDHGDSSPNALNRAALQQLLPFLDPTQQQELRPLSREGGDAATWSAVVSGLRAKQVAIAGAMREARVRQAVGWMGPDGGVSSMAIGRELARLDARDELAQAAQGPRERGLEVAIFGFIALGDVAQVDRLLDRSTNPGEFLSALLDAEMHRSVLRLVERGALSDGVLLPTLINRTDGDSLLASLLVPDDGRAYAIGDYTLQARAIAHLVATGDVERLLRAAERLELPGAINGLLQLQAYEAMLERIRHWPADAAKAAAQGLCRVTGVAEPKPAWPEFSAEQDALIEAWRAKLQR